MYIARRHVLGGRHLILRAVAKGKPAIQPTAESIIDENSKRIAQYNTLLVSRQLWENSTSEANNKAFKVAPALREVSSDQRTGGQTWRLSPVDAPERHFNKAAKDAAKPFEKYELNDRDAPMNLAPNKLWYSPQELLPRSEDDEEIEMDDTEDPLENSYYDRNEFLEERDEEDLDKMREALDEERNRQFYYKKLEREAAMSEMDPNDETVKILREDQANLDEMEIPDTEYKPPRDNIVTREQKMMDEVYLNEDLELDGGVSTEQKEIMEERKEMKDDMEDMEEDRMEGGRTQRPQYNEMMQTGKQKCQLCGKRAPKLHPMNVYLIARFISGHGDIFPRKITGLCMRHQRDVSHTWRKSKGQGLINFKNSFALLNPFEPPGPYAPTNVIDVDEENPQITSKATEDDLGESETSSFDESEPVDENGAVVQQKRANKGKEAKAEEAADKSEKKGKGKKGTRIREAREKKKSSGRK